MLGALGVGLAVSTTFLLARPAADVPLQVDAAQPAAAPATPPAPATAATVASDVAAEVAAGDGARTEVAIDGVAADAEATAADADIERWLRDLRDDDIRGNALAALRELAGLGTLAAPHLERALASPDRQQRQLAALLLRQLPARGTPSAALLRTSVEALRRDVCASLWSTIVHPVATSAAPWLADHAVAARPALRDGITSGDDQQRFLCAYLLAAGGHDDDRAIVVRELVTHLEDNRIAGDAVMAAHALYRLGSAAMPHALAWRPYVDEQARALLDLVADDLRAPPRTHSELTAHKQRQRVTDLYHDPALEYVLGRPPVAVW